MRHVFVTVLRRRWCLCCDLYQTSKGDGWVPKASLECCRTTAYASAMNEADRLRNESGSQPEAQPTRVVSE